MAARPPPCQRKFSGMAPGPAAGRQTDANPGQRGAAGVLAEGVPKPGPSRAAAVRSAFQFWVRVCSQEISVFAPDLTGH